MITAGSACPVCIGRATFTHGHPADVLAAATERNETIDAACKEFATRRDRLRAGKKQYAYDQMLAFERALDRAKDAAWAKFRSIIDAIAATGRNPYAIELKEAE